MPGIWAYSVGDMDTLIIWQNHSCDRFRAPCCQMCTFYVHAETCPHEGLGFNVRSFPTKKPDKCLVVPDKTFPISDIWRATKPTPLKDAWFSLLDSRFRVLVSSPEAF